MTFIQSNTNTRNKNADELGYIFGVFSEANCIRLGSAHSSKGNLLVKKVRGRVQAVCLGC
jgi:hypothetical protein